MQHNTPIDRTAKPTVNAITQITLPKYEISQMPNGIPLYLYDAGTQPVVRIDIVFKGGRWLEMKAATAATTIKMMREGTRARTSAEIAAQIDRFKAI